jgi:glyoxylase-like metal-dependent hydrolase (beta-lactamase superfamily II)/ferredoxin
MAHPKRRLPGNAEGDFYVDDTCIDCDTCRWLAPDTFVRKAGQSAVGTQPADPDARHRARLAAVACPTASIGTLAPDPEMPATRAAFPVPVDGEVFYCGYHSEKSYGAAAYLIVRPEGNVLVDSPRRSETLAGRIEAMGGARWMFLTHGDDVADHVYWHERLGCDRILHAADAGWSARGMERLLEGTQDLELAPDLRIIPVPGHTEGSCCLLYRDTFLFTGDHLAWSERRGHLYAFRDACWHSWEELALSMEKLSGYPFEWVLPGHGRRFHAPREAMRERMRECLGWIKEGEFKGKTR